MSRVKAVLVAVLLLALAGCSTIPRKNPEFKGLVSTRADDALVYFFRPKRFTGGGVRVEVSIDGVYLMTLPNCAFMYTRMPAGEHTVSTVSRPSFSQTPDSIKFSAKAGNAHYFLLDIDGSIDGIYPAGPIIIITSSTSIQWRAIEEEYATKLMTGCYSVSP